MPVGLLIMTPEKNRFPSWARIEHLKDFEWIGENLGNFWPLAREVFKDVGRGALMVDTIS